MAKQTIKSKTSGRVIEVSGLSPHQNVEIRRARLLKAAAGLVIVAGGVVAGAVLSAFFKRPGA